MQPQQGNKTMVLLSPLLSLMACQILPNLSTLLHSNIIIYLCFCQEGYCMKNTVCGDLHVTIWKALLPYWNIALYVIIILI